MLNKVEDTIFLFARDNMANTKQDYSFIFGKVLTPLTGELPEEK
jgi:hypothetical protein